MTKFKKEVQTNNYLDAEKGVAILKSLIEDITENNVILKNPTIKNDSDEIIENLLNKFHRISRQLRIRHNNRCKHSIFTIF